MIRPVVSLAERPRRAGVPFILFELVLLAAVPVLGVVGLRSLLESRAGTFAPPIESDDAGYRELVDPTSLTVIAEITNDRLTGLVVVSELSADGGGGALIVVSADTVVDDVPLGSLSVDEAVGALERELHLRLANTEVVDGRRWEQVASGYSLQLDNPDPIAQSSERAAISAGPVTLDASEFGHFLGWSDEEADPRSLVFRRQLFWAALLAEPPPGTDPVAGLLQKVAAGPNRVEALPVVENAGGLEVVASETEALVLDVVPFPAGALPGDRLRVRILDRFGDHDVRATAGILASEGLEIVEVGNVGVFDSDGTPTELLVPLGLEDPRIQPLAERLGAAILVSDQVESEADGVVTLLVGAGPAS